MEKFKLKITEDQANYLQRLGVEIDAYTSIIDRMFTQHKSDVDASVIESPAFVKYYDEYKKTLAEYSIAKDTMTNLFKNVIIAEKHIDDPKFDWSINDFTSLEAEVILY